MSQVESDSSTDGNPYNQAGLTSLIIGLCTGLTDDSKIRSTVALIAPFISYAIIYLIKDWRKKNKIKKACLSIDNNLARIRTINQNQNLPANEREENEREIIRLSQLRTNTELQQYDVK
ncbi:hypothetical protein [Spirosoma sp.]|uniref:hypothetical protein n=1 Tax=Spirosoma sp. TaxID=1899569 RepID=UPI0026292433|nr:hypothetical protein [Spirosoma sp.]MCX6218350.1 hypothetical protein [Spirosoma sp.]